MTVGPAVNRSQTSARTDMHIDTAIMLWFCKSFKTCRQGPSSTLTQWVGPRYGLSGKGNYITFIVVKGNYITYIVVRGNYTVCVCRERLIICNILPETGIVQDMMSRKRVFRSYAETTLPYGSESWTKMCYITPFPSHLSSLLLEQTPLEQTPESHVPTVCLWYPQNKLKKKKTNFLKCLNLKCYQE